MRPASLDALALALPPATAKAQAFDGTQGIDTYTGPVISASRILGLGGTATTPAQIERQDLGDDGRSDAGLTCNGRDTAGEDASGGRTALRRRCARRRAAPRARAAA